MPEPVSPGLILALGAFLIPLAQGTARKVFAVGLPLVVLIVTCLIPEGRVEAGEYLGYPFVPVALDPLARVFALAFALVTVTAGIFALQRTRVREVTAAYVQAGCAMSAVVAGDWITLFVCWEVMALASTVIVWSGGTPASRRAGLRYFAIHAAGGVLFMMGILRLIASRGTTEIGPVSLDEPGAWFLLAGVLVNAGAPPVSSWVADSYPEASPAGSVFLSAFVTKTAVYVLLRCFAGTDVLVPIGLFMVFYGIVYALLENDMRRILAYSIVNQVGFMVCGAGIGGELAVNGAASHAFAHIQYKGLLLMSAGSVLWMTGRRKCTELGGIAGRMPLTTACSIIGALAISGFPLTSGYVTKPMISSAAGKADMQVVWYLLAAASAGVFLHAGIKFPWFVFFHRDSGLKPREAPVPARVAMLLMAAACLVPGIWPAGLHGLLPHPVSYHAYEPAHVVAYLQLLLFAGLAFFLLLPVLARKPTISLDTDWLYRRVAPAIVHGIERALASSRTHLTAGLRAEAERCGAALTTIGRLPWTIGLSAALVSTVLLLVLVLSYRS